MHLIVLLQTKVSQTRGGIERHLFVLVECDVFVATQLEVGPFLVNFLLFAIDHLLDLLVLDVGLDDLS